MTTETRARPPLVEQFAPLVPVACAVCGTVTETPEVVACGTDGATAFCTLACAQGNCWPWLPRSVPTPLPESAWQAAFDFGGAP